MDRDKILVLCMVSTLFVNELWTLEPYSTTTYQMFPYAETWISKRAYYALACHYAVMVIILMVLYTKFETYRVLFGVWFILNALEFVEYFLTYNKALYYLHYKQHQVGVNMTNIKYVVLIILTGFELRKR